MPHLISPLGIALGLILLLTLLAALGRRWRETAVASAAFLLLFLGGSPWVAKGFVRTLESQYPPVAVKDAPSADAIILLGGGVTASLPPRLRGDLNEAADRVLFASRLYRAGKAPYVIASGGSVFPQSNGRPQSAFASELLVEWGVPEDAILVDTEARNTYEEAVSLKQMAAERRMQTFLLVTSAMHMPRARAVFQTAGLDVIPVPTDFEAVDREMPFSLLITPNADELEKTTRALREYLGIVVYRMRGWID
ncbi:MAG: YdcF family protein [Acidobacteriota bacterium]|nr:MAG: YdcF family protein [Acidobacteriota bacterium]